MPYRVVFMGSPDFAVPSLEALLNSSYFSVVGVVTQPDRPAGRGNRLRRPPIKVVAQAHDLPVYQPHRLRGDEALAQLRAWSPDVQVVAAYGQILRSDVLHLPAHGSVNVHASLLPRWRGAAPIHAAIQVGDTQTGITIMQMDEGLDTGPILDQRAIPIAPRETGQTLHDKLAQLGAELLPETLFDYLEGRIDPQPQRDDVATVRPTLKKSEGRLDWTQSAQVIDRHVRAFTPWPGTFTHYDGQLLKILAGEPLHGTGQAGLVRLGNADHPLLIGTGEGLYAPTRLQLAGKKALSAQDFLNGYPSVVGTVLGQEATPEP